MEFISNYSLLKPTKIILGSRRCLPLPTHENPCASSRPISERAGGLASFLDIFGVIMSIMNSVTFALPIIITIKFLHGKTIMIRQQNQTMRR